MSLYCSIDSDWGDGYDLWWGLQSDESVLQTKYRRKCCSCKVPLKPGSTVRIVERFRHPTEFEETRGIASDQVNIANWYLCEKCGDLADSLSELDFCFELGNKDSIAEQIAEYRKENG